MLLLLNVIVVYVKFIWHLTYLMGWLFVFGALNVKNLALSTSYASAHRNTCFDIKMVSQIWPISLLCVYAYVSPNILIVYKRSRLRLNQDDRFPIIPGYKLTMICWCIGCKVRLHLVGVIIEHIEHKWEKSREKMVFVVVWLRVEKGKDFYEAHKFSLLLWQNTISPNWEENWRKSGQKYLDKIFIFPFYFFGY